MMKNKVAAWTDERNSMQGKIKWRFKTEDARIKLKHLYPVITSQQIRADTVLVQCLH